MFRGWPYERVVPLASVAVSRTCRLAVDALRGRLPSTGRREVFAGAEDAPGAGTFRPAPSGAPPPQLRRARRLVVAGAPAGGAAAQGAEVEFALLAVQKAVDV